MRPTPGTQVPKTRKQRTSHRVTAEAETTAPDGQEHRPVPASVTLHRDDREGRTFRHLETTVLNMKLPGVNSGVFSMV